MNFEYTCSKCGKKHSGPPSLSFQSPEHYLALNDEDKKKSYLNEDLCVVLNQDYFIRVVLEVPIIGANESFLWGIWVSQSKSNYEYYSEHFDEDLKGRQSFGWIANVLPGYQDTLALESTVLFGGRGSRPKIHLHESKHQLAIDFHQGMSMEKAIQIAEKALHL